MFESEGSLNEAILAGRRPSLMVFSGQDPEWAGHLMRCLHRFPGVRPWVEEVLAGLGELVATDPAALPALANDGLDPADWLDAPDRAFSQVRRASVSYCLLGSVLGHLSASRALAEAGVLSDTSGVEVVTGHSAGLFSAWAVARHGVLVPVDAAIDTLYSMALLGEHLARGPEALAECDLEPATRGASRPAVMLSVAGATEVQLRRLMEPLHGSAAVTLQNSWDRLVCSGAQDDIDELAELLEGEGGLGVEAVPSSVPFHHDLLAPRVQPAVADLLERGLDFSGPLSKPLVDPRDASTHHGGQLVSMLVESMFAHPVRWADTLAGLVGAEHVVLDVGPSPLAGTISRRALQGSGATVVSLGTDDGIAELTGVARRPRRLAEWSRHLPRVNASAAPDSPHRVQTLHTRRSHRSAFVLPGMNPTTVDVGIVAAAASAGHVAEVAGGGQVSATIFSERMAELAEVLPPGQEVTFNLLNLDPYLWDLHVGRDRMLQRARAAGAPVCGVTVSAGIPELKESVELLEELNDLGIWLNAFKPGTIDQVGQVLQIASQVDFDVWLHMEGGRAGGHHSWVELEDLLFATYAEIREHSNVVLCVGGGIGDPRRAADLLGGTWSLRHCAYRMPVDAVLLGTVAMAVAESTASPSVKAALVAAPGTPELVRSGEWGGGVTSARSSLGADIHCLHSHAARVAELLEEVAGDADAVAARHDEIAAALEGTMKPWFGDLSRMTYAGMLDRFVELCARGSHGRYEDGRWFDQTHRSRFLELLRRAEARCCDQDEGVVVSLFAGAHDLDDPGKAVALLRGIHPLVESAELVPTDVAHFVQVCDGPGKPVPFVAMIDAEVRRRYLVDSLWQSHSDLWSADQVLAIPGPVAVAGITRVDEPVAELFERFDREVAELLAADGVAAPAQEAPTSVEVLLGLAVVRNGDRPEPSPLRSLGAPDRWALRVDGDEVLATLTDGDESATLRGPLAAVGEVRLELRWPALTDLEGDGSLKLIVRVGRDHGVPWAEIDAAALAAAQRSALDDAVTSAEPTMQAVLASGILAPAPLVDAVSVPDAAIRLLWPGLFDSLRRDGAGEELLQLVHARHRVAPGWVFGDGPVVHAEIVGHDQVAAGRRIHTRSRVGDHLVEDVFLIRGRGGPVADESAEDGEQVGSDSEIRWEPTERHHLGTAVRRSPRHPEQYGCVSGDLNPIHRSNVLARFTGLPGRIVHGMWTSATAQSFLVSEVLDGEVERIRDWEIDFLGILLPGERIRMTATRVAVGGGRRRVEVVVEGPRGPVAQAHATVAPVLTAYVFPGQGIQARGMGMDGYNRSTAARDVWDHADRYCRRSLGFSVIEVVRDNPTMLKVRDELHRHPDGVLHLTQFTQVAMATLAAAQVAEMRAAGVLDTDAVLAGHSVGEYNALAAVGEVLPLEAVLGIVWARGTAMHHLVPRDSQGASRYRLGVVRPHLAGLDAEEATRLVAQVAQDTGELCQVVNHNLRGRQYAVAGTVAALEELAERLGGGERPGRDPFLLVPGIDVPFHSEALRAGVSEFRAHLQEVLPERIDATALIGRYVPNLHPVPFDIDRGYVEAVAEVCGGEACGELLASWEELVGDPDRLARELLVELLAWQFASPVRWIETTDVLLGSPAEGGLGVRRVVEVGLGASPTLANLTSAAVAAEGHRDVTVLHVELAEAEVFDTVAEAPEPEAESDPAAEPAGDPYGPDGGLGADWDGDAPGPALLAPADGDGASQAPERPTATGPVEHADRETPVNSVAAPDAVAGGALAGDAVVDLPVGVAEAVAGLLAHEVQVGLDQLGDETVERLVDGASSRRNQVLMDMGKEFGIGAVDGAHEIGRDELSTRVAELARSYRFPGPVLSAAMNTGVAAALGPLGAGPNALEDHLRGSWGLGEGWIQRCRLELFLGTRDGASRRGGPLRTLPEGADAVALMDAALAAAAARAGVVLSPPSAPSGGPTVDAAELDELLERIDAAVLAGARAVTAALGHGAESVADSRIDAAREAGDAAAARLAVLEQEHGGDRAELVAPSFDPSTVRWFSSGLQWARADLDHLFHDLMLSGVGVVDDASQDAEGSPTVAPPGTVASPECVSRLACFAGVDERFDATLGWYRRRAAEAGRDDVAELVGGIAAGPDDAQGRWMDAMRGRVVLVSGASPGSIAESVVARLLEGGAIVVSLTSSADPARRRAARELERRHGAPGAQLHLAQANLASFTDVDRICDWLASPGEPDPNSGTAPSPGLPDVVLPFAAPSVMGDLPDSGPSTEVQLRVLLLGIERLVGGLSERIGAAPGDRRLTAVLPMSPNHGVFGGDGAYGVAKAGLDVLIARKRSERTRWGAHCRIVAAEIGWVRSTGLMSVNDELVGVVEQRLGIRTWSATEMGSAIAELCAGAGRTIDADEAVEEVRRVDLTGGLASLEDPGALADLLRSDVRIRRHEEPEDESVLGVLPTPRTAPQVTRPAWPTRPELDAADMIVICGVAEIGPFGTATTRGDVEFTGRLSAQGVLELALRCGLIEWRGTGAPALVDVSSGEVVAEHEVVARYEAEVRSRCGIRADEEAWIEGDAPVFSDRPITVGVGGEAEARAVAAGTPGARVCDEGGVWQVELPAGSRIRLPRRVDLPRRVTAPLPDGLEPTALGLPVEISASIDPLAAWNLATSAEAFRDAGTDPDELLTVVHPAKVADTQGCGMGGMESLRGMFLDPVRGVSHANDLLQEALPNVPAAHAMQSLLGGYGSMIHPVGACATAAVSLEVAVDLVRLGKADVVLAGGYDDLAPVSIIGFADMAATADDAVMAKQGFEPAEMSRPGDRSRAGFVEGQGGGSMVVCRGTVALALGLPVRAVVGLAVSHSDGIQSSIPAPGLGALSVAAGGAASPLGRALAAHGLCADDIAVVSKHDTSTRANDPNESAIHERIQELIGRSAGNPLRVVSQKSLTGHAKGGAAAWQVAGLCDVFDRAVVPGNPNLDSVDPDVYAGSWLVPDDRPLAMWEAPRAALLTSLGFGHVAAVVMLVHPAAFEAALEESDRDAWTAASARRRADGDRLRRWQPFGGPPAFKRRPSRLRGADYVERSDSEREMLADPTARLGVDGLFVSARAGGASEESIR
jgi:fatty acid synthase